MSLFFVGAPLGAIIRKGGLGLPLVVSILLFLGYHFFGIFAQNSAESGGLSPFLGAWIATLIMLPLGIYLTYRATTDQGFINTDVITDPIKKLFLKLKLIKKNDDDAIVQKIKSNSTTSVKPLMTSKREKSSL